MVIKRGAGPLFGIKVVDFSQAAAGPFCAQQLGDLGADVIKVEPPGGDMIRGWDDAASAGLGTYFMGINRSKRSIELNLKTEAGLDIAKRLCKGSDVLIENYRPGTMARLGLGFEDLRAENSRLVYVSISAFGETGPLRDEPGMDIILQAFAGIMGITGVEGGEPVKVGAPIADLATAYVAAMATIAALYEREKSGSGQRVALSMLNAVVSLLSNHTTGHLWRGNTIERLGSAHPQLVPYQAFKTSDGHYLIVGILNERFWRKFCAAVDRVDLTDAEGFATNTERVRNRRAVLEVFETIMLSKSVEEWEDILARHDVPHTRVNSFAELFAHPQVDAAEIVTEIEHPELGSIPGIAQPARFERTPIKINYPPPSLGEHSEAILRELGFSDERVGELVASGVVGSAADQKGRLATLRADAG